jgi:putative phosphonate catabolism associated alcohol dehydrogenase
MRPTSAKAAVFLDPGQPFRIQSFPLPTLQHGETLVRIRCATICGSDLHTHAGRRISPTPSVLGHEMVGHIAAISGASPFAIGDRVTWSMVWSCGQCPRCLSGLHAKCERLYKFGHAAITDDSHFSGGFAEYCLLPAGTSIFKVPHNLSDPVAAIANCATATVAATLRLAGPLKDKSITILGAGMLGLNACSMARHFGAGPIHVIDSNPARAALAVRFGASGHHPGTGSASIVMDFTGSPDAMESAIHLLDTGGTFVLAGAVFPSRPIQIPAEQIVRKCLRIVGVHNYSPTDLEQALQFLASTIDPFDSLIEGHFTLDQINEAFAYATDSNPPRVSIYP